MTEMIFSEIVSLVKDLILSGAAVTGAVVAIKGLGTWQRQLKGQSEYELSRRILVSLFKYRDSINGVRNPVMMGYEMPTPPENESKNMSYEQINYYGTSKAYQNRWDKVQKERTTLYADLLEAEALWGKELNDLFKIIFDLERELFINIHNYLTVINPDTDPAMKEAMQKIRKSKRDIMYSEFGDESEVYQNEFKAGVENIERYLKPRLSHK
jgi:hypothetical protein